MSNTLTNSPVYQSRFGCHPCDYQTFLKLKKLNAVYFKALRQLSVWERWDRKAPQNRVIRKWIRNTKGQKVGCSIIGPRAEPELSPVFHEKIIKRSNWDKNGCWYNGAGIEQTYVHIKNSDVCQDYKNARHPQILKNVKPLKLSLEEIDRLYFSVTNS